MCILDRLADGHFRRKLDNPRAETTLKGLSRITRKHENVICPIRRPRCVVVDGCSAIVRTLELILTGPGWAVSTTAFAGNAFVTVLRSQTSLLITGLKPSRGCGLRLIAALRARGWSGRVVIVTTRPELIAASVMRGLNIAAVLRKPFKLEGLRTAVG